MKKRIKRKVVKRIINKVGAEQSLTYFERKYFIKFFWKPLKKVVNDIIEELEVESEPQIDFMRLNTNKLSTAEIDFFSKADFSEGPEEPIFYEPSKWQKAKAKVKGWFGK